MAHNVTCQYCKGKFDRDKIEYAFDPSTRARRYLHASCAQKMAEEKGIEPPKTINPLDFVICCYCKKPLNQNDLNCVIVREGNEQSGNKFAHKECYDKEEAREKTDEEKLDSYIMKLFKVDHVPARIQKQINDYIADYNFSYSGIHKSLVYFYDVKGNSLTKSNGGIGIVPYIYKRAYEYYYSIWEAQQLNEDKDIKQYIPKITEVVIPPPKREIQSKKLFSFLDEEVENGE